MSVYNWFSVVQVFYRENKRIILAAQKTGRTQPPAAGCPVWALQAASRRCGHSRAILYVCMTVRSEYI